MAKIEFTLTNATGNIDADEPMIKLDMYEGPFSYTLYIRVIDIRTDKTAAEVQLQCAHERLVANVCDPAGNREKVIELVRLPDL